MIRVEVVVAGGLGELAQSMFPDLVAERHWYTRVVVDDQVVAAELLAALGRVGIEVDRVTEISTPARAGQPPVGPPDAPEGSAAVSSS